MSVSPTFTISGQNYASYISELKWARNDLDSEDSGRTLDGIMQRSRVAIKRKLTITLKALTQEQMILITAAIEPQFIDLTYIDPRLGSTTKTFYGSSIEAAVLIFRNGTAVWENGSFSLIEK